MSLEALVAAHPLHERFHAQLVLALYRSGRQTEAEQACDAARAVLLDELGLEPGAELRALERGIRSHDPALTGGVSFVPELPHGTGVVDEPVAAASGLDRLPLVGREDELAVLIGLVADATAGRGSVAVIEGEAGIGKSRLADEVATRASAIAGSAVGRGRNHEGLRTPAFWPWASVVEDLVAAVEPEAARAVLGDDAAALAQVVPEVKELVPGLEPLVCTDPDSARFGVLQALTGFLRRLGGVRSVVVVLDDIQWADRASLDALVHIARSIRESPVLVLATIRTSGPDFDHDLGDAMAALSGVGGIERVVLEGLGPEALSRFLAVAGPEPTDELVATIAHRTRGNPFFVTEVLRMLPAEAGAPDARSVGRIVPQSVQEVIRHRIAWLPDEVVHALAGAAAVGAEVEAPVLAAMLDLDGGDLLDRIEPALRAGILEAIPDTIGRYRFSHGLVQETVYGDMGAAQRARMHHRAAHALDARLGGSDGPHLFLLADHWFRAVPVASPERGIELARRAAIWALDHVAHQQADEQLERALELIGQLPAGRERASLELDVLDHRSLVLIVTTSYTGADIATAADRIRVLCDELDEPRRLIPALWRLAAHHMLRGASVDGLAVGEELLDRAAASPPGPDADAARLVGHLCLGILQTQRGALHDARVNLDACLELCRRGADAPLAGQFVEEPALQAHVFSAYNHLLAGDDEAADAALSAADVHAARGEPGSYSTSVAMWGRSTAAVLRRDASAAFELAEAGMAHAAANQYSILMVFQGVNRGWAAARLGDAGAGAAEIQAYADAVFAAGALYLRPLFLALLADATFAAGDHEAALASIEEGLTVADADRGGVVRTGAPPFARAGGARSRSCPRGGRGVLHHRRHPG